MRLEAVLVAESRVLLSSVNGVQVHIGCRIFGGHGSRLLAFGIAVFGRRRGMAGEIGPGRRFFGMGVRSVRWGRRYRSLLHKDVSSHPRDVKEALWERVDVLEVVVMDRFGLGALTGGRRGSARKMQIRSDIMPACPKSLRETQTQYAECLIVDGGRRECAGAVKSSQARAWSALQSNTEPKSKQQRQLRKAATAARFGVRLLIA